MTPNPEGMNECVHEWMCACVHAYMSELVS